MKRLALVLAATAAALGTGCGSSAPCHRDVTVDWSQGFLMVDGVKRDCGSAGVAYVDLFVNDDVNTAVRVPCSQHAAQAVDLPSGTNLFTVEGVESNNRIAFRAEVSVPAACGNQTRLVAPAEGTLALDYSFSPSNVCYASQPTYIWSEVRDDIANQIAYVDNSTSSPVCSTTATAPTFLLPAGNYTLVGVNEWSPSFGIVGADCSHPTFVVGGAATTTVTPVLVDSAQACF